MSLPSIALLHHVSNNPLYSSLQPFCISRQILLQLLNYIVNNNIETVTFAQIAANSNLSKTGNKKIILTFDDCSRMLWDFAIPELLNRNLKAVFYIPTANIGGYNSWDIKKGLQCIELMKMDELKQLDALGMEVGSHSHNHIRLKYLDKENIHHEITSSKQIIESIIEKPVCSFAYPFGSIPNNNYDVLSNAGYKYACGMYVRSENNFALRRFLYHNGDTETRLGKKLSGYYRYYRKIADSFTPYTSKFY